MTLLIPIMAGIGALCFSNPARKARRKSRRSRRNPPKQLLEHWGTSQGYVILRKGQKDSGALYSGKEAAETTLRQLQKQYGSRYAGARVLRINPSHGRKGCRRNPRSAGRKISKKEYYALGGMANSDLYRKANKRGVWAHYKGVRSWRNPGKKGYYTIAEIRAANKAAGNHYFDRGTMKFFRTTKVIAYHNHVIAVNHYPDGGAYINIAAFNPATGGVRKVADATSIDNAKNQIDSGSLKSNPRRGRRNPRVAKTKLVYVVQGNYGYGWDDENEEDNRVDAKRSIKEYRDNGPGSYRLIRRRVKIETNPRRRRSNRRGRR